MSQRVHLPGVFLPRDLKSCIEDIFSVDNLAGLLSRIQHENTDFISNMILHSLTAASRIAAYPHLPWVVGRNTVRYLGNEGLDRLFNDISP